MTDVLIEREVIVIEERAASGVLLERAEPRVDLLIEREVMVIEERTASGVLLERAEPRVDLLTEVRQGPPGPPGTPGQAGVGYVTFLAQGAVGGHRVTRAAFAGHARYADSSTVADATAVLGISLNAADDGAPVNVASSGEISEPSWAWIEDASIFVGAMGLLTQTPPTSGFQLVVGVATSPTSMLVGIKQPIIL